MNTIPSIFSFENQKVRTLDIDGSLWFVAKDVAEILKYANPQKAIRDHCKSPVPVGVTDSFTLDPQTVIIPERDIYRLVMKSKLKTAERFENWVVSEVLPSIRKTGSFTAPVSPELQLAQAVLLAQGIISEQKLQIELKDKVIAEIQPKAAIADRINNADGLFKFRAVAKMLAVSENVLREWLVSRGWVYYLSHTMTAKSAQISLGYLREKCSLVKNVYSKNEVAVKEMYFTSKGVCKLAKSFGKEVQLEMPLSIAA